MKPKSIYLAAAVSIAFFAFSANAQNALDFDGIDDYVMVPGASSVLTGATQLSLALWVYPTNATGGFPYFDGYAGFRNETTADFYILQLSSTNIEARMRNSLGATYDIVYTGLNLNTWNHFVLTFSGSQLKLYHDGQLKQTITASGMISSSSVPLYIGKLPYQTSNFLTDGKLDDVALWSRALSLSDIQSVYSCGAVTADSLLKLHYTFDQGVAGGNNSTVTTLIDSKGNINGTLYNMALSGSSSNWVSGVPSGSNYPISAEICPGDSVLFVGQYIKQAGTYSHAFPTSSSCDSIVTLTLSHLPSYEYFDSARVCENVSYQWQGNTYTQPGQYQASYVTTGGCDSIYHFKLTHIPLPAAFSIDGSQTAIQGQTSVYAVPHDPALFYFWNIQGGQILNLISNDSAEVRWLSQGTGYVWAHAVNSFGCRSDTMELVVSILTSGIATNPADKISIYPNPATTSINIETDHDVMIAIYDLRGRLILSSTERSIDISALSAGSYLIRIKELDTGYIRTDKLRIQNP